MELKRVVVTGLGTVSPLGLSVSETWANVLEGKSGAGPITHFDASKFKTQFACEVKGFDPSIYFDRKEARKLDLYAQYAIAASFRPVQRYSNRDCQLRPHYPAISLQRDSGCKPEIKRTRIKYRVVMNLQ